MSILMKLVPESVLPISNESMSMHSPFGLDDPYRYLSMHSSPAVLLLSQWKTGKPSICRAVYLTLLLCPALMAVLSLSLAPPLYPVIWHIES